MWPTAPKNTVSFSKSPFPVFCTAGSRWHFCGPKCDFPVQFSQLPNPLDSAPQTLWRVWQHCCAWQKNTHLACSALHGAHSATSCPKCTIRQWGALTGHLRCIFFCPPATGYPGWRSGNARARCAGLRTPLGSCAARVRRAAESAAAPAADHGRVRDGWCYEHQCHRAPSRGRLRRARQPQLRRSASSTFTRS